jgi:hypothetical protein
VADVPATAAGPRSTRFQFGEVQLQLIEDGAALEGLAILLVTLGDRELRLPDRQHSRFRLGLRIYLGDHPPGSSEN